jgi:probable F420-dependent oxidoreductase
VKLGTVHSFEDLPGSPFGHRAVYEAGLEQVVRSEELGYDWVNITEHHVTDDGYCPALMPVLAAMAVKTERIGLSTGMLILPLHHPLRIAEEAAVVDVLSGGRLTLGVAAGYRRLEFDALGSDYTRRGRRLEESIEVLVRAWSGEPFSFGGETISFPEVTVRPRPLQRPHPRLWLGGVSEPALRRAVRHGSPCFPGATSTAGEAAERFARYRQLWLESGGRDEPGLVLPRLAFVGDTLDDARRRALPAIAAMFDRYVAYGNPPEVREALSDWALLDEYAIVGDEERCRAQVDRYAELGVTDLMLQFAMPTLEAAAARESMERFVAAVRPAPTAA